MNDMNEIVAYRAFIDSLLAVHKSAIVEWTKKGRWADIPDNADINLLLSHLSPEQRMILVEMLQQAVDDAVHDVLVRLDGYTLVSPDGVTLPRKPFGNFMHYDWMARCQGEEWEE